MIAITERGNCQIRAGNASSSRAVAGMTAMIGGFAVAHLFIDSEHVGYYPRLCCKPLARAHEGVRPGERACHAGSSSSSRLTNLTASAATEAPRPKARSTIRASPRMSRVMLKADACPLRSARITSKPLIVA